MQREPQSESPREISGATVRMSSDASGPSSNFAGELADRHGASLFAVAYTMLADRDAAQEVTVCAIVDACSQADTTAVVGLRELARHVYALCERPGHDAGDPLRSRPLGVLTSVLPGQGDLEVQAARGRKSRQLLSSRARSAIALGLFGDHTYREIADLMGIPAGEVAELLRSGLHTMRRMRSGHP